MCFLFPTYFKDNCKDKSRTSVIPHDERGMKSDYTGTALAESLTDVKSLYDDLIAGKLKVQDVETSPRMAQIENQLEHGKDDLYRFRTSKLWLQYMDMIDDLQSFNCAEGMIA